MPVFRIIIALKMEALCFSETLSCILYDAATHKDLLFIHIDLKTSEPT
jgi:hypothetical protein